jgi:outer membrane lipopolysaccharide assembly protein LptE/RlpB
MRPVLSLLSLLTAILCVSCGYHVGPVKPKKLEHVRRICVKNFKNETLEPRMEAMLASAVIKQLQLDGTYQVADEAHADAILQGTLQRIDRVPSRAVRGNVLQSSEYRLTITANYRLVTPSSGTLLDQRTVTGTTDFFVTAGSSGSNLLTADSAQDERQAMPLAVEDMATRISSLISEGW